MHYCESSRASESISGGATTLIGDGPQTAEYRTLAQTLGLRTSDVIDPDKFDVFFAGYRPNPLRYLKLGRVSQSPRALKAYQMP